MHKQKPWSRWKPWAVHLGLCVRRGLYRQSGGIWLRARVVSADLIVQVPEKDRKCWILRFKLFKPAGDRDSWRGKGQSGTLCLPGRTRKEVQGAVGPCHKWDEK